MRQVIGKEEDIPTQEALSVLDNVRSSPNVLRHQNSLHNEVTPAVGRVIRGKSAATIHPPVR